MRHSVSTRPMTVRQFLAFEEVSNVRHEYVDGEVFAMSGGTLRHNKITGNIFARLLAAARGGPCHVVVNDVLVRASDEVLYYPDVAVECAPRADGDRILEAPCLVVEVTSKRTRRTDRTEKLTNYRRMPSLRVYLIVDQMRRRVTVHARTPSGDWSSEELDGAGRIVVPCSETTLTLDDIYEGVELPPLGVAEAEAYEWGEEDEE